MNSEQLLLELGEPWGGISPRYLTRVFGQFSFTRKGMGRPNLEVIRAVQLELFPEGTSYGT